MHRALSSLAPAVCLIALLTASSWAQPGGARPGPQPPKPATSTACGAAETWSFEGDAASTTDDEDWSLYPAAGWELLTPTWASITGVVLDSPLVDCLCPDGSGNALGMNALGTGEPFVKAGMERAEATLAARVKVLAEAGMDVMVMARAKDLHSFYGVMMFPNSIAIERMVNGSALLLGTKPYPWTLGKFFAIRMDVRAVGDGTFEARAWVDGVVVIDWINVGGDIAFGTAGLKTRNAHAHVDDIIMTDFCD